MRTEMDVLVLENQILFKTKQPKTEKNETWKQQSDLDYGQKSVSIKQLREFGFPLG